MGFLDFMRIYIFSEVDGVVLLEGKPVSGATVVRTVAGLQAKGEAITLLIWALSRELRGLLTMSESGLPPESAVIKAGSGKIDVL